MSLRINVAFMRWNHESMESYDGWKGFQDWLYLLAIQSNFLEIHACHIEKSDDFFWMPQRNVSNMDYQLYNTLKMAASIMRKQKNWTSIELYPGILQSVSWACVKMGSQVKWYMQKKL